MPPVSGGIPACGSPGGPASAATVARSTSTGSPVVGRPAGGVPSQAAAPSRSTRVALLRTPTKEYRAQASPAEPTPCSADSSRKVPGPPASLR